MKPNVEEKKRAALVFTGLSPSDRREVTRWSLVCELCQQNHPGCAVMDDSAKESLEVVRRLAVQQIARLCRWSVLAADAGVGSLRLTRKVYCMVQVAIAMSDTDETPDSFGVFDENSLLTRPQGVVENLRVTYLENSGIYA